VAYFKVLVQLLFCATDENLVNLLYFTNLRVKKQTKDLSRPKQDVNHSNATFNVYSIWAKLCYAAPTPSYKVVSVLSKMVRNYVLLVRFSTNV
jgi:hypothetical protein